MSNTRQHAHKPHHVAGDFKLTFENLFALSIHDHSLRTQNNRRNSKKHKSRASGKRVLSALGSMCGC